MQVGGELIGAAGPAADTEVDPDGGPGPARHRARPALGRPDLSDPDRDASAGSSDIGGRPGSRDAGGARQQGPAGPCRGAGRRCGKAARPIPRAARCDRPGRARPRASGEATGMPAEARADVDHLADVAARLRRRRAGSGADRRSGRISRLRVSHRHRLSPSTATAAGARSALAAAISPVPASPTGPSNRRPASRCFLDTVIRGLPAPQEPSRLYRTLRDAAGNRRRPAPGGPHRRRGSRIGR